MDENRDRGVNVNDRILDYRTSTTRRSGEKNTSPEAVHGSEYDPFLRSTSHCRSSDELPGLSGNDRKEGPLPTLASVFWSQGVAKWRALGTRSNGNKNMSDSTAPIKEPGNPPTDRDTAESASIRSRILSSLESNLISAPSTGINHLVRPVLGSHVSVFDQIPHNEHQQFCPSPRDPMKILGPGVGAREHPSELQAWERHSTVSASASNTPTKSDDGKEDDSVTSADTISLHARRAVNTFMPHLEIEDDLQRQTIPGKTKPVIFTGPSFGSCAYSCPGWGSGLFLPKQRENLSTPPKPSQIPKKSTPSSVKATSHLVKPPSLTAVTPTGNRRIRHPESLSAEAPAFHPRPPSSPSTTPTRSCSSGHGRSVSFATGQHNPSHSTVMPNTPHRQRRLRPSRQSSMGTPSVPVELGELGVLTSSGGTGGASQPLIDPHYPEPHQHTPEGQGQCFDTQGSMPLQMPTKLCNSLHPNLPPVSSSIHPFNNIMIHYNAQVYEQAEQNAEYAQSNPFDTYGTSQPANATPNTADLHQNGHMYTQDTNGYGPRYYSNHTDPSHQAR